MEVAEAVGSDVVGCEADIAIYVFLENRRLVHEGGVDGVVVIKNLFFSSPSSAVL